MTISLLNKRTKGASPALLIDGRMYEKHIANYSTTNIIRIFLNLLKIKHVQILMKPWTPYWKTVILRNNNPRFYMPAHEVENGIFIYFPNFTNQHLLGPILTCRRDALL